MNKYRVWVRINAHNQDRNRFVKGFSRTFGSHQEIELRDFVYTMQSCGIYCGVNVIKQTNCGDVEDAIKCMKEHIN